jgi:hypothetical protein
VKPRTVRRSGLTAGALSVVLAVGCGASHPEPRTTSHRSRQPSSTTRGSSAARATQIVALSGLGSLSYRCEGSRGIEATLDPQPANATEYATVEGNNGRHLRAARLNPGPTQLSTPIARYRTLTWRVIQSTEPETLEATIRLYWGEGPSECSLTDWTSKVHAIAHQRAWTLPSAWP